MNIHAHSSRSRHHESSSTRDKEDFRTIGKKSCSRDGKDEENRRSEIKMEEKRGDNLKTRKLSRPDNEYFSKTLEKGNITLYTES